MADSDDYLSFVKEMAVSEFMRLRDKRLRDKRLRDIHRNFLILLSLRGFVLGLLS